MAGMEGQELELRLCASYNLLCIDAALYKYPEWWVVNSVGMVVGSGVIVMLGISFVPVLICVFMVLAAIYDYWAVHRSKHMLELADTMIDLKLPVVLVAPKDSSYSFREQKGSMSQRNGIEDPADSIEIDPHIDLSESKRGVVETRFSWAWGT